MKKSFCKRFMAVTVAVLLLLSCLILGGCGESDSDSGSRRKKDKTSSTDNKGFSDSLFGGNDNEVVPNAPAQPSANTEAIVEQSSEFGADSPEAAVNMYLDFRAEQQSQYIKKLAPAEYWDYIMSQWNVTPEKVAEYYDTKLSAIHAEDLAEDYGSGMTVTLVVEREKEVAPENLTLMNDLLRSHYAYSIPEATAAVCLYGKFQIESEKGLIEIPCEESDYRSWFYVVEINGGWYYVDVVLDERFGEGAFLLDRLVISAS